MPFIHANVKSQNQLTACWRNHTTVGDNKTSTLAESWNSEPFKRLRRQHMAFERDQDCRLCWQLEDSGATSLRQIVNQKYASEFDRVAPLVNEDGFMQVGPAQIELRFGNACDLRCRHCSGQYSTRWTTLTPEEREAIASVPNFAQSADFKFVLPPAVVDQTIELALKGDINHITMTGGEPLIQGLHLKLLQALQPVAQNISIEYNTNLNTLKRDGKTFIDLWRGFKEVLLRVSIDGDEQTYSYLRTFGDLELVKKHMAMIHEANLPNVIAQATCTVSIYNVTRFDSIIDLFTRIGCQFHASLVQLPSEIAATALPAALREETIKKIEAKVEEIMSDDYPQWSAHPRWSKQSRRDKQRERVRKQAEIVISFLRSSTVGDAVPAATRHFVTTVDKVNGGNFLDIYPEFRPFWPNEL